ncbi:hypothetical protein BpHYR1_001639 [Brachionus plicatilis]|uniref:RING-type domain-containing protein n=1 Tax=Brachionus plicatilis TaxID=10195 RepID=A0A3M7PTT7_BRAPC|nr:hypothetical protein BpHYR1_001639 [Brachionus plicatilis]
MDQLFNCQNCSSQFNTVKNIPKVLPCSDLVCLQCLNQKVNTSLSDITYECLICQKTVHLTDPIQLPDNKLLMHFYDTKIIHPDSLTSLHFDQKHEELTVNKHYDQVINNIDIKTELLILQLNNLRDSFIDRVNALRNQSLSQVDQLSVKESEKNFFSSQEVSKKSILNLEMVNSHSHLQANLYSLKENFLIFEDLTDKCLLGHVMNRCVNKNYFKIKNLVSNLKNNSTLRIDLKSEDNLAEGSIRQYLLPLSRNKIVKIYFSLKRDLTMDLFDQSGKLVKRVKALDNISSFPIVCSFGKHICISATGNVPNQDTFFSRFSHLILFDWDLNCVKNTQKTSMIESLYMNEKNLFLMYSHRSTDICEILDYNLDQIDSFGQQINPDNQFYFEKNDNIYRSSQRELSFPKVFGCSNEHVYMYNKFQMIRMCRLTGISEKMIEMNGEPSNFIFDHQKNIIKTSGMAKLISFYNFDEDISITSAFSFQFDEVFISSDDYLVFCDSNKEFLNFM